MGELGAAKSEQSTGLSLGRKSPDHPSISEGCLSAADESAERVVNCVRPTLDSEEKRRDVIDYVQRLIKGHLNCEVFPYGSVPLKTYLPDGDIDLTAFDSLNPEKSLALGVLAVLQREEKNENAEFLVKDTHFIDAEVKLVKCLVRNTVIDISFNQLGGIATLCFLEQVDRLVGRNHLFKRSIILVKTWCYYESRILGAHHGLMSTYALETLVLYIFHLFHSSLNGPLEVLYKFLDYYSQFDWENYCVSLKGPVCISSLPEIVVETPESGWHNLMLSEEFLENCVEMFSFTSRVVEGKSKAFQAKNLNIIDPLKENNNLGRSVSMGNFYRIRSAFKYGARKLRQILLQPRDKVAAEINNFFSNTLARHGNDNAISIHPMTIEFGKEESFSVLSSPVELFCGDDELLKSCISDVDHDCLGLEFKNEMDRCSMNEFYSERSSEDYSEVVDFATSNSSLNNGASGFGPSSDCSTCVSWDQCCKPSSFPFKSSAQIDSLETGDFHQNKFAFSSLPLNPKRLWEVNDNCQWCTDNSQAVSKASLGSSIPKAYFSDKSSVDFREVDLKCCIGGELESFNPLADLGGDYDSHIRSLLYGQLCHGFSLLAANHPLSLPSRYQNKNRSHRIPFSQTSSHLQSFRKSPDSALMASEGTQKPRGTGTYFLHSNGFSREWPIQCTSRHKPPGNRNYSHKYPQSNGNHVLLHSRSQTKGWGKFNAGFQPPHSDGNWNQTNCCLTGSYKIEFGSIGNLADEVTSASAHDHSPSPSISLESLKKAAAMKQERAAVPPIHLKNEAEFPPLCQGKIERDTNLALTEQQAS